MFSSNASSDWNRFSSAVAGALGRGARKSRLRSRRRGDRGLLRTDHLIEGLEDRRLLDAGATVLPNFLTDNPGFGPLAISGSAPPSTAFTPAKFQKAYGIDLLLAAGNKGQGQTVAIVDPYDWPTATTDLSNFSTHFGLPQMDGVNGNPTFSKVSEDGFSDPRYLPTPSSGFGPEEALDVEWVHSIAPNANIVLVEAYSNNPMDLFDGVSTAAKLPGVSVVSMSWGGDEKSSDQSFDGTFQTPSGDGGVTFLAGTGDNGKPGSYPAFSPNVVAVGGTSLTTDASGNYRSESGWSGSGGGQSQYEPKPSYQSTLPYSNRSEPDVSFDADPNTGVAFYDSYDFGTGTPWAQTAGTSLATPCWAGLLAIVNQERADYGAASLDGPSQVLPALYGIYNDPVKYAADFHDITTGNNGFSAGPGYDLVTGIGSPIANNLVPDLVKIRNTTTTSVSSSANSPVFGQAVTFTATVIDNAPGGTPRGTVTFMDGTAILGTGTLNGVSGADQATLTTSALSVGAHSITAVYSGNTSLAGSASGVEPARVQSVVPASGLDSPGGVAVDGMGDVFIADTKNNRVVEVKPDGTQTVIASGLNNPTGVAVDGAGDVFIADSLNNRVLKVKPDGTQSTVGSGLDLPVGVAVDGAGDVFIVDELNFRVVEVPVHGTQTTISAGLSYIMGVAVDGSGDVFIADYYSNRVREVKADGTQTTVGSELYHPGGVAVDGSGDVLIADSGNNRVVKVWASGTQTTVASGLNNPMGVTVDGSGDFFIADSLNNQVVEVNPGLPVTVNQDATTTVVSASANPSVLSQQVTFTATVTPNAPGAGTPTGTMQFQIDGVNFGGPVALGGGRATSGSIGMLAVGTHSITAVYSGDTNDQGSTSSAFSQTVNLIPTSVSVSAATASPVYGQGETFTATVITTPGYPTPTSADGTVSFYDGTALLGTTTLSGSSATATWTTAALSVGTHSITAVYSGDSHFAASTPGNALAIPATGLNLPFGVAVDGSGNLFISDAGNNRVVEVPAHGTQTTVGSGLKAPFGVAVDGSGDLFIADVGNIEAVEVKADGTQATVGAGLLAPFGVAVDGSGNVFIADAGYHKLVEVKADGTQATVGSGLNFPTGVAVDGSGNVFIVDTNNNRVVEVKADGTQATVGSGLNKAAGVAVDGSGNVFIADTGNNRVVEVKADGTQATVAAGLNGPTGVAVDGSGDVFIADRLNNQVVEVTPGLSVTVNQDATTTAVSSSANPSVIGQQVTFTATVTPNAPGAGAPTGTVQFQLDGVNFGGPVALGGGRATSGSISTLALGTHSITALYSGGTNDQSSTSNLVSQVVNQDTTTTSVSASANPSFIGQQVTFTATVTPNAPGAGTPTGTVQFQIDGVNVGGPVALGGGIATLGPISTLAVGTHSITAVYSGDTNDQGSTSSAFSQTVNLIPTSVSVSAATASPVYGQGETFTATIITTPGYPTPTSAGGTVSFYDGTALLGTTTLSGSSVTATWTTAALSVGTHSITAVYSGDSHFTASASGAALAVSATGLGVAVDGMGDVFIADIGNNRVVEVKFDGTQTTVGSGLNAPRDVAVDGSGDVFIADTGNNRVVEVPAHGTQTTVGSGLNGPFGVAVDGAGDIFIADTGNNRVVEVPAHGTQTTVGSGLSNPRGVAVDGMGNVFIADTFHSTVVEVPAHGTQTNVVGSGLSLPTGVAVDGMGDVFIADTGNNRVVEVTHSGTQTTVVSGLSKPTSVAADGTGDVFVAGPFNAGVVEVTLGASVTVNQDQTTTALASLVNPSVNGQEVTFTATVAVVSPGAGTPTGTVTFLDGATILGTGTLNGVSGADQATFTTSALSLSGSPHSITAVYSGDTNDQGSNSSALSQTVNPLTAANLQADLATTSTVTLDAATNTDAQTVLTAVNSLSAPASPVTITVELASGSFTDLTASPPAGVTLVLNGNGATTTIVGHSPALTILPSQGSVVVENQTLTTATDAPTILVTGGSLTLRNVVVEESTGFTDAVVSVTGGSVDLGTPDDPGGNTLEVNGTGEFVHNTTGAGIPASGDTLKINGVPAAAPYLSFTSLASSSTTTTYGQAVTLTATVRANPTLGSGTPTGSVDFFDVTTDTDLGSVPLSGGGASLTTAALGAGSHLIRASYSGDSNFTLSLDVLTQTVHQAATATQVTSSAAPDVPGQAVTFTATVANASGTPATPAGSVQFTVDGVTLGNPVNLDAIGHATSQAISFPAGTSHAVNAFYVPAASNFVRSDTTLSPLTQVVLGPGVSVYGTTLYLVGGSTSPDTASITPAGAKTDGSTGLAVRATLNKVSVSKTFTQTFTAIVFAGYAGNETFTLGLTLTLPATVTAGAGNNVLQLGGGNNTVTLGAGNNTVSAGGGNNTVTAGTGNNVLQLGGGNNTVTLGAGNNTIQLGDGSNVVVVGNGNDSVSAGNGNNLISGGLGRHTITVGNGTNILIDGSATVTDPRDSFRRILNDWVANPTASNQAAIRSRFTVNYNAKYANTLTAGGGIDWFFYQPPATSNKKATDFRN